jgi:hypothetical protein
LGSEEQTINLKYKKHGTLTKYHNYDTDEYGWFFKSEGISDSYVQMDLIHVLEDLSDEGWELVCPMIDGDGYIIRSTEYHEMTID